VTRGDAYGTDLAYIHDAGFGGLARAAGPVVLRELERAGFTDGLVLDLGCGSGILAAHLTDAGLTVQGIDQSPAMIALAEKRAPGAAFRCGSLLDEPIPSCIAVTAIGECFNYLFDETHSADRVLETFRRIHDALVPGGFLLFDAAGPGRTPPGGTRNFQEGDDWAILCSAEEADDHRTLTRRMTTFRKENGAYRRGHEEHRLRLLPPSAVTSALLEIGFRVQAFTAYDDEKLPPGLIGYIAGKRRIT
jgi:SAM-dependent methyltransferase